MKIYFSFLILFLALCSCSPYVFDSVQSGNGVELNKFPDEILGHWYCGTDSLDQRICDSTKGIRISRNYFSLDGKEKIVLSDSIRLFKVDNFYLLNTIEKDYSNSENTYYSLLVLKSDSAYKTIHTISEPWNVKAAKKMKKSKSVIILDTISEFRLIPSLFDYKIELKDLELIQYQRPFLVLHGNNDLINGKDSDLGYSCGEITKREIKRSKKIKKIMASDD